jgi:hypothetical protein
VKACAEKISRAPRIIVLYRSLVIALVRTKTTKQSNFNQIRNDGAVSVSTNRCNINSNQLGIAPSRNHP